MLSIIGFIITIIVLVFVHEFGHYYVAKISGIKIEEFSIGFGKVLFSKIDKIGTKWNIRAIPLGGFVKMYGDRDAISSKADCNIQDKHLSFYYQKWYIKCAVVVAGPIANYILAFVILAGVYLLYGYAKVPAIIGDVINDSPASFAGLLSGDEVLAVDKKKIKDFNELQKIIVLNTGTKVDLLINRQGIIFTKSITPKLRSINNDDTIKVGYIGITAKVLEYESLSFIESVKMALNDLIDTSFAILKYLHQMISGQRSLNDIRGPVTIAKTSGDSLSSGILSFILFLAMLSINLGFFNLLPIPVLDGGHLVLIIAEAIIGKPIRDNVNNIFFKIGIAIILLLIITAISNDIMSIIF